MRALDPAIDLPRRPVSASWMLGLLTPPDVRRNFMRPPASRYCTFLAAVLPRNPICPLTQRRLASRPMGMYEYRVTRRGRAPAGHADRAGQGRGHSERI